MRDLSQLTDALTARLHPSIPKSQGKPHVDDRRAMSGIISIHRNELGWCDASKEYGPAKTIFIRWKRWGRPGYFCPDYGGPGFRGGGSKDGDDRSDLSQSASHSARPAGEKRGQGDHRGRPVRRSKGGTSTEGCRHRCRRSTVAQSSCGRSNPIDRRWPPTGRRAVDHMGMTDGSGAMTQVQCGGCGSPLEYDHSVSGQNLDRFTGPFREVPRAGFDDAPIRPGKSTGPPEPLLPTWVGRMATTRRFPHRKHRQAVTAPRSRP